MGLDRRDYTKSSPSGTCFLRDTPSARSAETKNLTRRANHRHLFIIAAIGSHDAREPVKDWSLIIHLSMKAEAVVRRLYPRATGSVVPPTRAITVRVKCSVAVISATKVPEIVKH
jgi:hypothetical protein